MVAMCKGACHSFSKPTFKGRPEGLVIQGGGARYSDKVGRCKTCVIWIDMELDSYNNRCNCCKTLVRHHPIVTQKNVMHKRY